MQADPGTVAIALPQRRSSYDSLYSDFSSFMVGTNATSMPEPEPESARVVIYALNPMRSGATFEQVDLIALSTYSHSLRVLSHAFLAADLLTWEDVTPRGASIADVSQPTLAETAAHTPAAAEPNAPGPASALAAEVRSLSGVSTEKLSALVPVERETYQRWLSGRIEPSEANLERLLLLRSFFLAAQARTDAVSHWLLTPSDGPDSSPFEALRRGDVSHAWELLRRRPLNAESAPSLSLADRTAATRARTAPTNAGSTLVGSDPPPTFGFFDDDDDED